MQSRNEPCGCRSGKKYKKCCGRFSLQELTGKLSEFASSNRRKERMIERGLKLLTECEGNAKVVFLCLVNPQPTVDGLIDWTVVGNSVPEDEREAVVTRRVIAGFLPMGCLRHGMKWCMILDRALVPEEYQAEYVAFARREMNVIAGTMDGNVDHHDSWTTPVAWSDRSYPGQPAKPRRPGTIKIEVDIQKRSVRIISQPLSSYLDMPIDEDMIEGKSHEADAIFVAQHVIEALKYAGPPNGTVTGDMVEIYLMRAEGTPKLLARTNAMDISRGITGEYGMGGSA
jgi:hypothetical protein